MRAMPDECGLGEGIFFVWEETLFGNMLNDLEGWSQSLEEDRWSWRLEENEAFSVKSMYMKVERVLREEDVIGNLERRVFRDIWKSPAPSKTVAFSWKLLYDQIPTRSNLAFRNVLPPNVPLSCVLCDGSVEVSTHLFLHCQVSNKVWQLTMGCLHGNFTTSPNLFYHWECWSGMALNIKVHKVYRLIWHATIWMM